MLMDESSPCTNSSPTVGDNKRLIFLKKNKFACYSKTWIKYAVAPLISLKMVLPKQVSGGGIVRFVLKVTALEFIRRVSKARCPQLWWGLQVIPLLHVSGLSWLQNWTPLKFLSTGTRVFSKPIICLSMVSHFGNVLELKKETDYVESSVEGQSSGEQYTAKRCSLELEETTTPSISAHVLRQVLDKDGVTLTERINNDELEIFLLAAHGNVKRAAKNVKKTLKWRETFHFLSSVELERWSHLVFWHGYDAKLRPILLFRLGAAYLNLSIQQQHQFAQGIISQVEYGVLNLVHKEDPRIVVVMDCGGTSVLGFPVHMMKSCCVCLQKNYPTRLACLIAVNVPAVVRVIATAIIQVLTPATRQKIYVEGETYISLLERLEGLDHIALCLAGSCKCSACYKAHLTSNQDNNNMGTSAHSVPNQDQLDSEQCVHNAGQIVSSQTFKAFVRKTIVGLLMVWIFITLMVALSSYPNEED